MKVYPKQVTVIAPARLHMGFMDLSGALGRHFGSVGIALNEYAIHLSLVQAEHCTVQGACVERAELCLKQLCQAFNVSDQLHLTVTSTIPEHVGLGSGTQMALAIGQALNGFYQLDVSIRDIAAIMGRGLRSGIGIGVFEQGGLIVDGGRGAETITPPVLSRLAIPDAWRFILVFDKRGQGLHGQQEIKAFDTLPPFPQQEAARLCYLLLMQGLPAVAENNLNRFGEVISQLQQSVGEHFAPAQGGVFTSPDVAEAIYWLQQQGAVAIGQTSWGPTGFCAVNSLALAEQWVTTAQEKFAASDKLSFNIVSVRNTGAEITIEI